MLSAAEYAEVFLPSTRDRLNGFQTSGTSLAHYTSASNAMRILRNARVTLRNARLMNDFSEIDHGESCLLRAWHGRDGGKFGQGEPGRLASLLSKISPTIVPGIEHAFDGVGAKRKTETFLLSLSELDESEEGLIGKLSMWRAYGGSTNVALVVDPDVLFSESAHPNLFSAPVVYRNVIDYPDLEFVHFVNNIEKNFEKLAEIDRDTLVAYFVGFFNVVATTTKHPGFKEENEWRILYAPWMQVGPLLESDIVEISGLPQRVFYVGFGGDSAVNFNINDLFKKIIIGPTENPWVLYEAFVCELEQIGVDDAASKVLVSDIPIRR